MSVINIQAQYQDMHKKFSNQFCRMKSSLSARSTKAQPENTFNEAKILLRTFTTDRSTEIILQECFEKFLQIILIFFFFFFLSKHLSPSFSLLCIKADWLICRTHTFFRASFSYFWYSKIRFSTEYSFNSGEKRNRGGEGGRWERGKPRSEGGGGGDFGTVAIVFPRRFTS